MPMYNPIEYSSNYSETTGRLWFLFKDEATDFKADIANEMILNLSSIMLNYQKLQLHRPLQMKLMRF